MKNVRKSKINIESIREFFVSGHKQLLVSQTTMEDLEKHELPLVMRGSLSEGMVESKPIVVEEPLKAEMNVAEQTPIIQPSVAIEENVPLMNAEIPEREVPIITPVELTPETPLIKGNPNNVFVKAGSAINGFDVTENIPVIKPILETENDVERSINEQVNTEAPRREVIGIENIDLETPQAFNERLETATPKVEVPIVSHTETNPYILANVEIEKIRKEFNDKISNLLLEIQELKENTNLNLDNVSRSIEKARQMSQNDAKAIMDTMKNGINSLNEVSYSDDIHIKR